MASFAQLVSTGIPTHCSRALRLSEIHVHWRISPWENEYLHCHAEKMPNNAGNEGRVASSVSSFCIPSHSSVWIHGSVDKAQLPHTFSTHSSLYKSFTTTECHCGYQHFSLYSSSSNTRTFWMLLDPKWLTWSLETRVWIPRSLYFVDMGLGRG